MKSFVIHLNNRDVRVYAEYINDKLWLHAEGETFSYSENRARAQTGSGAESQSGEILAPMPGKVTKVLKKPGEKVARGEVVLVLEAMKMEYSLRSGREGQVKSVSCRELEQVELGQALAEIE